MDRRLPAQLVFLGQQEAIGLEVAQPIFGIDGGQEPGHGVQVFVVAGSLCPTPIDHSFELRQLGETDRSLDVGHAEVEPVLVVGLMGQAAARMALVGGHAHAVRPQPPEARSCIDILRHDHAAFARCQQLPGVEREDDVVRMAADPGVAIDRADCTRGIFDDRHAALAAQCVDLLERCRHPDLVHHDHGLGPGGQHGFDGCRGCILRGCFDITEHRVRTHVAGGVRRGDEGE